MFGIIVLIIYYYIPSLHNKFYFYYLDVDILLSAGLIELDAELLSELPAAVLAYHTLFLHVTFITHEDNLRVVPRVRLYLGYPATIHV